MITTFKQKLKGQLTLESLKSWAIALLTVTVIFALMITASHADDSAINGKIDKIVGKGSWIQKVVVVGAFFAGMVMCFFKQIVLGISVVAVIWSMIGIYNSGLLF